MDSKWVSKFTYRFYNSRFFNRFDRLTLLAVLLFGANLLVGFQLFNLQVVKNGFYSAQAAGEHVVSKTLFPKRGEIFVKDDGNEIQVATNKTILSLSAVPKDIDKAGWSAKLLSEALNIDQLETEKKLNKISDPSVIIKRKLSDDEVDKVKALEMPGLFFTDESGRYYPDKALFSHVIGFVGYSASGDRKKGQYGLEGHWDKELTGEQGYEKADKDLGGRWIASTTRQLDAAQDGDSFVLTLDRTLQYFACKQLSETVRKFQATGGSLVITNPQTGAVLVMCGLPDFDPNTYNQVTRPSHYNNPAIFLSFEPGSIFKSITMAAGLDLGLITPETTYKDEGFVKIGKFTIKNAEDHPHKINTMTAVLEQSLNTGTVFVAEKVGLENFRKYVHDFGFGLDTGIELDTENAGDLSALDKQGQIYLATGSFGQGITATPLQMAAAYGAIANGGRLMKPYIISEIIKADGTRVKTQPEVVRQVISSRTAQMLSGMLVAVVKNGTAKKASVPGYLLGAKTGTAQVAENGVYSKETIHSFIGFGPADDAKFVIMARIDRPKGVEYAESTVAPLFKEIAAFLLNYWKVSPTEPIK